MGASVFCCSGPASGDPCQFFSFHHITSLGTACGDSVFCSVTDFCESSGTASGDPFVPFDFIASFLWAPPVATLVLSLHRIISVGTAMAAAFRVSRHCFDPCSWRFGVHTKEQCCTIVRPTADIPALDSGLSLRSTYIHTYIGLSGPLWDSLGLSGLLWASLRLSGLLRASLGLSL